MPISILVAGDVVPMRRTIDLFKKKNKALLFGTFYEELEGNDLNIVNFEAPIVNSDSAKSIDKYGPSLSTGVETLEVLKESVFNMITLANNHFRDYGQNGVSDTINAANNLDVSYVGGGKTFNEARKIFYYSKEGKTIAIINACEHEFSIATDEHGGSNPIDLINMPIDIASARKRADKVILILHGGVERYQLPTPRMKRWYRYFVDLGADIVINHHQHCFSGYEVYNGKPIFYGLGNFCFDSFKEQANLSSWNYGFALKLSIDDDIQFSMIPYINCGKNPGVEKWDFNQFSQELTSLNNIICNDKQLRKSLTLFVEEESKIIKNRTFPKTNRIISFFMRKYLSDQILNKQYYLKQINHYMCESHNDVDLRFFDCMILRD